MNINHWLVALPLNSLQEKDYKICETKLVSLFNLPLKIHCLPSDILVDQVNLSPNHRNPLKMYWQRNLTELRLFLKSIQKQIHVNLIEIYQRKRLPLTRFVKQDILFSSIVLTFSQIPSTTNHLLCLTISSRHCLLEIQIPSVETDRIYRGTYRKMGEDAQLRSVTALFNCTITIDYNLMNLLNEYGLCRRDSDENLTRNETKRQK